MKVLGGLRAENQAHFWGTPASDATARAKEKLKELFCPATDAWRSTVVKRSLDLVERAKQGLLNLGPSEL